MLTSGAGSDELVDTRFQTCPSNELANTTTSNRNTRMAYDSRGVQCMDHLLLHGFVVAQQNSIFITQEAMMQGEVRN